ncbi:unnamed protein product [Euphydryas editha]|uniref:Uncharacterized protein n=1 Tax=Euphydryas editha TaxID=104508 RepID=A0AAU9UDJ3_EUPED|nr:unnamed protein product [Euphydryas editha]
MYLTVRLEHVAALEVHAAGKCATRDSDTRHATRDTRHAPLTTSAPSCSSRRSRTPPCTSPCASSTSRRSRCTRPVSARHATVTRDTRHATRATHYERAELQFAALEDAAMYLTVRLEHVAALEVHAAGKCATRDSDTRHATRDTHYERAELQFAALEVHAAGKCATRDSDTRHATRATHYERAELQFAALEDAAMYLTVRLEHVAALEFAALEVHAAGKCATRDSDTRHATRDTRHAPLTTSAPSCSSRRSRSPPCTSPCASSTSRRSRCTRPVSARHATVTRDTRHATRATHYERAELQFAALEDAAMYLTVRLEHVAALEVHAAGKCATRDSDTRHATRDTHYERAELQFAALEVHAAGKCATRDSDTRHATRDTHYERAELQFAVLEDAAMYLTVRLEHVAALEVHAAGKCATRDSDT